MSGMSPPPTEADGAKVLAAAELDGLEFTEVCVFRQNGVLQTGFAGLLLARYSDGGGCYLFYCDGTWTVQNDTFHETVEEATAFAERQYPDVSRRWVPAAPA